MTSCTRVALMLVLIMLKCTDSDDDAVVSPPVRMALLEPPDGGTYRADVPLMLDIEVDVAEGQPECILEVSISNPHGEGKVFRSSGLGAGHTLYRQNIELSMPDTYTLTASVRYGIGRVCVVCVRMRACARACLRNAHCIADRRVFFCTQEGLQLRRICVPRV